jgi:hypothetical protein
MKQESIDYAATLTFFLKSAYEEGIYFGGYSSNEAWEAFAMLMYNMNGGQLYEALNKGMKE